MRSTTIRALAAASSLLMAASVARSADPELRSLSSLDQLRQEFEQDAGTPRLVLLLSPT